MSSTALSGVEIPLREDGASAKISGPAAPGTEELMKLVIGSEADPKRTSRAQPGDEVLLAMR